MSSVFHIVRSGYFNNIRCKLFYDDDDVLRLLNGLDQNVLLCVGKIILGRLLQYLLRLKKTFLWYIHGCPEYWGWYSM